MPFTPQEDHLARTAAHEALLTKVIVLLRSVTNQDALKAELTEAVTRAAAAIAIPDAPGQQEAFRAAVLAHGTEIVTNAFNAQIR